MRTPNSFDSLDPIPSKLGCKLEAPRSISKERRKLVDNWIFETANHRLVVDLPTLTCKEVTEADCRQIKLKNDGITDNAPTIRSKSEYNTFIERQKELMKEAAADGWIEWHGGNCPVAPETIVDLRFRDGVVCTFESAGFWSSHNPANCNWHHSDDRDIVAYRIVK
jgi:hypothetical protein